MENIVIWLLFISKKIIDVTLVGHCKFGTCKDQLYHHLFTLFSAH